MSDADLLAGSGIACLGAVFVAGGVRDALERALTRSPELLELLQALYRDLAITIFAVTAIALIEILRPALVVFLTTVVVYVVLMATVTAILHSVVMRTWHRWDRETLRAAASDLQHRLQSGRGGPKSKVAWLMGREIFCLQFISGNADLSGFSYVRYLRLALSDVCLAFLPMSPSACVAVGVGIVAIWGQGRLMSPPIYLAAAWESCSLLYLILALRRLARIRSQFFIDPKRLTPPQLASFLSLGMGQGDADPDPETPRRRASAPVPLLKKLSDKLAKPKTHTVVSVSQPDDDGFLKSASEFDTDEISRNTMAAARDLVSVTRLSGTPRPQYAPSAEASHRIAPLTVTDTDPSTRRPYFSSTDYSATNRAYTNSRNNSLTAKAVVEMSRATHGRGSVSVMTPRARISANSMTGRVARSMRMKTEPEPEPGKLSFSMAVKMMLLRKRAQSYAQGSARDPHSSESGHSDSSDSLASAGDLVRMFGGSQAAQAMSAELPDSLRWWASPGPSALLKMTHSFLALDAIVIGVAIHGGISVSALFLFWGLALIILVKLLFVALLLKEFTLVTSSGSMARVELMSLSSRKLSEYERGQRQ